MTTQWRASGCATILAAAFAHIASAGVTYFVDASRPDDLGAGTNWATAKQIIQSAVSLTSVGDTVLVTNGLYNLGGATNSAEGTGLTNRVCVDKAITVQAVSANPADTRICGAPDPFTGSNGNAAVRGVYLAGGASLIGFTVSNGYCRSWATGHRGGGVYAQTTSTVISNCVITMNAAYQGGGIYFNQQGWCHGSTISNNVGYLGGGVYAGTYTNCLMTMNGGYNGGGVYNGTYYDCQIVSNTASATSINGGGGGFYGTYYNCLISSNYSKGYGGGLLYATLVQDCRILNNVSAGYGGGLANPTLAQDCEIRGNTGGSYGGGCFGGAYNRCQIVENTCGHGGGARAGTFDHCLFLRNYGEAIRDSVIRNCLVISNISYTINALCTGATATNCTIVDNTCGTTGCFGTSGRAMNCIVYNNTPVNFAAGGAYTVNYTCTTPTNATLFPDGVGNITNAPSFAHSVTGDYRLVGHSWGVDVGTNLTGAGITNDYSGARRPQGLGFDMGCYEYVPPPHGTVIMLL